MDDKKYAEQIRKTGFVLEYKIAEILRRAGWTVISNKYYEDDFEGSVREIDLLAYKVSKIQGIDLYTTLLFSCKKSESDIWALLARKINLKDPNADWWPLHAWSNNKAIAYEISKSGIAKTYHEAIVGLGVKEVLSTPEYEVFAFQEMNRISGAPHNDKNIFLAVTSLLKAQAYEFGALSRRKKNPSIYQFNLASIIESDLVRLVIDEDDISQEIIEDEHYISRYIIKNSQTFSRIRFITYSSFEKKLKDYDQLHKANCKWFDALINSFYDEIFKDQNRVGVFLDEFRTKIWWDLFLSIDAVHRKSIEKDRISISWNPSKKCAAVEIEDDEIRVQLFNQNLELRKRVAATLKRVYRYAGDFNFEVYDIPF